MATIEQEQDMLQKLKGTLAELAKVMPDDLVREQELGKELSFRSGLPYFARALKLFHALEKANVNDLAYGALQEGVPRLVEGGGGGRCTCYATFSCGVADFFARPKGAARVHRSW